MRRERRWKRRAGEKLSSLQVPQAPGSRRSSSNGSRPPSRSGLMSPPWISSPWGPPPAPCLPPPVQLSSRCGPARAVPGLKPYVKLGPMSHITTGAAVPG